LGVSDARARVGFGGKYLSVPHFETFHFGSDKLNYYNTPNAPCSHPLVLPMTSSCMKMEMWHTLQDILLVLDNGKSMIICTSYFSQKPVSISSQATVANVIL